MTSRYILFQSFNACRQIILSFRKIKMSSLRNFLAQAIFICIVYQLPIPVSSVRSNPDFPDGVPGTITGSSRVIRAAPSTDVNKKWPDNTVYYEIDDELYPDEGNVESAHGRTYCSRLVDHFCHVESSLKEKNNPASIKESIERGMQTIQNVSCIRYVSRTSQVDYVRFQHNTTKCIEPVGRQGGAQIIYINIPECGNLGFYIHASMQVLGFYHEHQRVDRDDYITLFPENIQPEWVDRFDKLDASSHFHDSTYDTDSIMHYGSFQFSKNGKPTILTKTGNITLSWEEKAKLSTLDIVAINKYYNCTDSSDGHQVIQSSHSLLYALSVIIIRMFMI